MSFKIVIPARFQSSRLPGKPLLDIAGKPMIAHVYHRAIASDAERVIIATDDQRIVDVVKSLGAEVCLTKSSHTSGTDRLAEVAETLEFDSHDVIVNVQGDEPCLPASLINQVAQDLITHKDADIASLYRTLSDKAQILNPNNVKVVTDNDGYALYFSRAPIPWLRDHHNKDDWPSWANYKHHIGLYSYRAGFLKSYSQKETSDAEVMESLEQLRALSYGCKIHMTEASIEPGRGVDTQQDLDFVRTLLNSN